MYHSYQRPAATQEGAALEEQGLCCSAVRFSLEPRLSTQLGRLFVLFQKVTGRDLCHFLLE